MPYHTRVTDTDRAGGGGGARVWDSCPIPQTTRGIVTLINKDTQLTSNQCGTKTFQIPI